ncbi:het-s domain-containingprotein [Purpureocillium lavendulum]|uniref:Het-s domain-containingprotein n=1 Tax=Purpureocillium lavendulum TaxID=1247861 RepID=A0AB34FWI0_9HYPO|nr:het-s domain-containingprotein [Purpureocillium lavendulum]
MNEYVTAYLKGAVMQLLFALAPLLSAVAALVVRDGPNYVKIKGVSLLGSGCPAGTADVQVDATGSLFEATFSQYEVETGPGTYPSDWRKNCKLTLNMEFQSGFQDHFYKLLTNVFRFTIVETDMIGFAEIPAGVKGQCTNTFSFTGNGAEHVDYKIALNGHYSGTFDLQSRPGIFSWSPCGGSTAILNMNTACNITPTKLPALIAVDHISGKLTVKFAVDWRPCPK